MSPLMVVEDGQEASRKPNLAQIPPPAAKAVSM